MQGWAHAGHFSLHLLVLQWQSLEGRFKSNQTNFDYLQPYMQKANLIYIHSTHYLGPLLTFISKLLCNLLEFPTKPHKGKLQIPTATHRYSLNSPELCCCGCDISWMILHLSSTPRKSPLLKSWDTLGRPGSSLHIYTVSFAIGPALRVLQN